MYAPLFKKRIDINFNCSSRFVNFFDYSFNSNKIAAVFSSGMLVFMEIVRPQESLPAAPKSIWEHFIDLFSNRDYWLGLGLVALVSFLIGGTLFSIIIKKKK